MEDNFKEHIKIYDEIKEKCYKSIIDNMPCEPDNVIKINSIVCCYDNHEREKKVFYSFNLNKYNFQGSFTLEKELDREEIIGKLIKKFAQELTPQLIRAVSRDAKFQRSVFCE